MEIPEILLGTFQIKTQLQMDEVVEAAISANVRGFDTAPSYGTEEMLGNSLSAAIADGRIQREKIFIQDKIDAVQMYNCACDGLHDFVNEQLKKLSLSYIDALLIHWPFERYIKSTWDEMIILKNEGLVKHLGICNIDERGFYTIFENKGLSGVEIIQNEISPMNVDSNNTIFFQNKGLVVEAYSPFCRMNHNITDNKDIVNIANKYGVDIGRVILQWHIERGIHPIFASQKRDRIISNSNLTFKLSESEIELISGINQDYKIFPISHGCPGY